MYTAGYRYLLVLRDRNYFFVSHASNNAKEWAKGETNKEAPLHLLEYSYKIIYITFLKNKFLSGLPTKNSMVAQFIYHFHFSSASVSLRWSVTFLGLVHPKCSLFFVITRIMYHLLWIFSENTIGTKRMLLINSTSNCR